MIEPFNKEQLNPNSYDVRLGNTLKIFSDTDFIDVKEDNSLVSIDMDESGYFLEPNKLYLASTVEKAGSNRFVPKIQGKSSLARLGLSIHQTGAFGDLGFIGHWTLELSCLHPIKIYPNMPIGQLSFEEAGECDKLYNQKDQSKYADQKSEPVESKYYQNFEEGN